jgi:hypothetical protein
MHLMFAMHGLQALIEFGCAAGKPWDNALLLVGYVQRQRFRKIPDNALGCALNFLGRNTLSFGQPSRERNEGSNAIMARGKHADDVGRFSGGSDVDQHFK